MATRSGGKQTSGVTIGKTRGLLYHLAKLLGDFSAVSSGSPKKVAKRAGRRLAGKATGRLLKKLLK